MIMNECTGGRFEYTRGGRVEGGYAVQFDVSQIVNSRWRDKTDLNDTRESE